MCACVTLPTSTTSSTLAPGECAGDEDCFDAGIDCFCSFNTCHCSGDTIQEMELELLSDVPVGALQLQIDYSASDDEFRGTAGTVDCVDLTGSLASFNDDEDARFVGAGFISLTGIGGSGALPLMDCILLARGELPVPSDFTVTVTDAADVNVVPIVPLPEVRISRIATEGADAWVAR